MMFRSNSNKTIGRFHILFVATFDIWIELKASIKFVIAAWCILLASAVPIGIASGFSVSKYVKIRLSKINDVTKKWREGKFDERIQ